MAIVATFDNVVWICCFFLYSLITFIYNEVSDMIISCKYFAYLGEVKSQKTEHKNFL